MDIFNSKLFVYQVIMRGSKLNKSFFQKDSHFQERVKQKESVQSLTAEFNIASYRK